MGASLLGARRISEQCAPYTTRGSGLNGRDYADGTDSPPRLLIRQGPPCGAWSLSAPHVAWSRRGLEVRLVLHAWHHFAACIYPCSMHATAPRLLCARLIGLGSAFSETRKPELPGNDSFLSCVCLFATTRRKGSLVFFPANSERNPNARTLEVLPHWRRFELGTRTGHD